jgi:uncharacterized membrane protein
MIAGAHAAIIECHWTSLQSFELLQRLPMSAIPFVPVDADSFSSAGRSKIFSFSLDVNMNAAKKETTHMSNLIVVGFENETDAFQMRGELAKMQTRYLIDMEDAVVVTRDTKGKVQLHQTANLTASGAVSGAFWGSLIGLLFFNPILGVAVGTGTGALTGALADIGINDHFMKDLGATIRPGTSALFVLVRKSTPDKVLQGLQSFSGKCRILQTSLTKDREDELRRALEAH